MRIDITNLDKAALLQALFNRSKPLGLGFFNRNSNSEMTYEQAQRQISDNPRLYFDYVNGRVIKIDLSGNDFDPYLYDRDNGGAGSAERVVESVKNSQKVSFNKADPQNIVEELAAQGDIIAAMDQAPLNIPSYGMK